MSPADDPVAAWLRHEVNAGRLKPTISDSAEVAIAGILLHAGSSQKKTAGRARHRQAAKQEVADGSGAPAPAA